MLGGLSRVDEDGKAPGKLHFQEVGRFVLRSVNLVAPPAEKFCWADENAASGFALKLHR
jgi:hypothetical protein